MKERRNRLREPRLSNRRVVRREKPTKWWADPIRWIPIVLSAIALTISYWGWRESHRGRLINEEINRPVLTFSKIETTYATSSPEASETVVMFRVVLKNTGRFTARIQEGRVTPIFLGNSNRDCQFISLTHTDKIQTHMSGAPTEILSDMEGTFMGSIIVSSACNNLSISFFVTTEVEYYDNLSASDKRYKQRFSQSVNASLDFLEK